MDERAAAVGEGGLRRFVAGAVTLLPAQAAFAASVAVDVGLDVEERRRVELVGLLAAAPDVSNHRPHAEYDGKRHGERVTAMPASFVHGNTS
jgi:hypothetical protein